MQVQTGTKTSNKRKKEFNIGDKVMWSSQANGYRTDKRGTIVAVLAPNRNYRYLRNMAKSFYESILRPQGYTRDQARTFIDAAKYTDAWVNFFKKQYQLKFNPREGMYRETYHYLVAVPGVGEDGKPFLYHPATPSLTKV